MNTWLLDNAITVSFVVILVVVVVAVLLLRYSYRVSHEKSAKSVIATFGVNLLMTVLIGLWLNNLLARSHERTHEREQRLWVLRQEHLARLRPTLRMDSDNLAEVTRRIDVEGRVTDINKSRAANEAEFRSLFFPDILSKDLTNHYPRYAEKKQRLQTEIQRQEAEFYETTSLVMKGLSLPRVAETQRTGVAWSFLEKCLEKGPGVTLTMQPNGYQFHSRGGSYGVGGTTFVAAEHRAAFEAFRAYQPNSEVAAHCDAMKRRGGGILENARKLSAEARDLAERTTLPGNCEYIRID